MEQELITMKEKRVKKGERLLKIHGHTKYTPKELLAKTNEYEEFCKQSIVAKDPKTGMKITKPFTKSGLNLFLGVDKDYVKDKENTEGYEEVVALINEKIVNYAEERLMTGSGNVTWLIFYLKNRMNWVDKSEVKSEVDNKIHITFN